MPWRGSPKPPAEPVVKPYGCDFILKSVGIESSEKLIAAGAKDAFLRLKQKYPNVCLVHLYTLEGAIHDTEFNRLSEDTKKDLKTAELQMLAF